jgi:hypothetical protein
VLVNLGGDLPPGFSRFDRLIEIVGTDETDRIPARERFKFYRDRGYAARGASSCPMSGERRHLRQGRRADEASPRLRRRRRPAGPAT